MTQLGEIQRGSLKRKRKKSLDLILFSSLFCAKFQWQQGLCQGGRFVPPSVFIIFCIFVSELLCLKFSQHTHKDARTGNGLISHHLSSTLLPSHCLLGGQEVTLAN